MRRSFIDSRLLKLGLLASIVFACSEPTGPRAGSSPSPLGYAISDAAHGDGNQHVFFLPPMVAAPKSTNGKFDPNVAAEIDICELTSAGCLTPFVAQYSRTTGSGSETIRLDGEQYVVNWHTDRFPVSANRIYRIRLRVLNTILGFADVQVFTNASQAKNAVTGETFALVDGRTLPIKFRIEEGAAFVFPTGGGVAKSADGKVEMAVPAGALKEPVALTVAPAAPEVLDDQLLNGGVYEFGPSGTQFETPITVTLKFSPADIPFGNAEENVRVHMLSTGADGKQFWEEVEGSTVDLVNHTVSGLVPHFSKAAAKGRTPVASIQLSTLPSTVTGRAAFTYYAYPLDAAGNVLKNRVVTAASSAPGVLSVSAFTYLAPNAVDPNCISGCYRSSTQAADVAAAAPATITVTSEGSTTSFTRTIAPVAIKTVTITPSPSAGPLTMRMYETSTLSVSLLDVAGLPVTNRQLTWSSVKIAKLTSTDAKGYTTSVEALDRGAATLKLSIEGSTMTASQDLKITSPPVAKVSISPDATVAYGDVTVATKVSDVKGVDIPDAAFSWTVSDPAVAELNLDKDNTVRLARVRPLVSEGGTTKVTVTSEGLSASMTLTFLPAPITSIRVDGVPSTITGRQVVNYTVYPMSANGTMLRNRAVNTVSTAPSVLGTSALTYVAPIPGDPACANGCYRGTAQAADVPEATAASITVSAEGVTTTSSITVNPVALRSVTIDPMPGTGPLAMRMYETRDLTVSIIDVDGLPVTNRRLTWTGGSPIVSVTPTGPSGYSATLAALDRGTTTIELSVQGSDMTGSAMVKTSSAPVARLAITPSEQTVPFGNATFEVKAYDSRDAEIVDASFVWTIADASVAQLDPRAPAGATATLNMLTADGAVTTVSVSSESVGASAQLTVLPEPVERIIIASNPIQMMEASSSRDVRPLLVGASGMQLFRRHVAWTSDNPDVAIAEPVEDGFAQVYARSAGTTTLHAESEGVRASLEVTVLPRVIDRVVFAPTAPVIELGGAIRPALYAMSGDVNVDRPAVWSSDNAAVQVDPTGLLRGAHMGDATITATIVNADGSSAVGTLHVQVVAPPIHGMLILPMNPEVFVGAQTRLAIQPLDQSGDVIEGLDYDVTASNDLIDILNLPGGHGTTGRIGVNAIDVIGLGAGNVMLEVRVSGTELVMRVPVSVQSRVDHIVVTPNNAEVVINTQVQFSATAYDASGVALPEVVKLKSDNETILLLDPTGVAKGIQEGKANLIAIAGAVTTSIPVTVVKTLKAATVEVSTKTPTISDVEEASFTTVVKSAGGVILKDAKVQWKVSDRTVAEIQPDGALRPLRPGVVTVTATADGISGSSLLTITAAPGAEVRWSSTSVTMVQRERVDIDVGAVAAGRWVYRNFAWATSRPDLLSLTVVPMSENISVSERVSVTAIASVSSETEVELTASLEGKTSVLHITLVPRAGRIVLVGGLPTLSDQGFALAPGTATFVRNFVAWSGGPGRFRICLPSYEAVTSLVNEINTAGGVVDVGCSTTVPPSEMAATYRALFVSGAAVPTAYLRQFVLAGGSLLVLPGGHPSGAFADGAFWNQLLIPFGLSAFTSDGGQFSVQTIDARYGPDQSLFSGVQSLYAAPSSYIGPNSGTTDRRSSISQVMASFRGIAAAYNGGPTGTLEPVASVESDLPKLTLASGERDLFGIRLFSASHNTLLGRTVEWSTSRPDLVSVSRNSTQSNGVVVTAASNIHERATVEIAATVDGRSFPVSEITLLPSVGRVIVTTSANVFDNWGFQQMPGAEQFARNISNWFGQGAPSRFLVCVPPYYHWDVFAQVMTAIDNVVDFDCTFSRTATEMAVKYSGIFISGSAATPAYLADYVRAGGNVFVAASSAQFPSGEQEAAFWTPMLSEFGLALSAVGPDFNVLDPAGTPTGKDGMLVSGVGRLMVNRGFKAGARWVDETFRGSVTQFSADGDWVSGAYDGGAPRVAASAHATALEVSTATPIIMYTQSAQFTAMAKFGALALPATAVEWTTSDPSIATVANGLVTPRGVGKVTVTAASDGVTGSAELDITGRWYMSTNEYPNAVLRTGEYLQSKNGQFWLVMQADCNLVFYRGTPGNWANSTPRWASGTNGRGSNCKTVMQGDGNLVVYNGGFIGLPLWGSGVRYNGSFHISVEDDGRFMLWEGATPNNRGQAYFSFQ